MKNFCKKIAIFLGIVAAVSATSTSIATNSAFAAEGKRINGDACEPFAGLVSWDCGVDKIESEESLKSGIVVIATNILTDLTIIASYLILGFVIWGGYLYMFSSGDPGKVAAAKKTLTNAFIGLAIAISATVIFSSIRIALVGDQALDCFSDETHCMDGGKMVTNLVQWVGGIAGAAAAIFLVVGAWGYMTSNGDPGKLEKAKKTILYAIIGLVIVAFAEVLTAFISTLVRQSNEGTTPGGFIQDTSIVKEIANSNKEENDKI